MERDVAGGRGEVAVIVAAAVALTGLAALVAGNSASFPSSSFRVSSTLLRTNSLIWPLITSLFSCTIFSDIVCCLLSNVCVVTSFYQSLQAMSSFTRFLICATYCTLGGADEKLDKNSTQKLFKQPKGLAVCELQVAGPLVLRVGGMRTKIRTPKGLSKGAFLCIHMRKNLLH